MSALSAATAKRFSWAQEFAGGVSAACTALPFGLSAGVLVFAPLGPSYVAFGAAAGLIATVVAGSVAAMIASNSCIVSMSNVSTSLIPAGLVASSVRLLPAAHPSTIISAVALSIALAGLLQVLFGVAGLGKVVKFTPHSVIVGFIDSAAALVVISQLHPFFSIEAAGPSWVSIERGDELAFIVLLFVLIHGLEKLSKRVPGPLAGLAIGTALFYILKFLYPALNLGDTLGNMPEIFGRPPIWDFPTELGSQLWALGPHVVVAAMALAMVATLQSFLTYRMAQSLLERRLEPNRDLIAQGLGNLASALTGGISVVPSPSGTAANFRAGGRTRLSLITVAVIVLLVSAGAATMLSRVPIAVLSAILLSVAVNLFDKSTVKTVTAVFNGAGSPKRHSIEDFVVIAIVLGVSVASSLMIGALAGVGLACLLFIIRMSRPAVRRVIFGGQAISKRVRSREDAEFLMRTGRSRAIIQLEGALFFGNSDDLSALVLDLLGNCQMVLVSMRGVSDVDASGAAAILNLAARANKESRYSVSFCNVPEVRIDLEKLSKLAVIHTDAEDGLEWMEDQALRLAGRELHDSERTLSKIEIFEELSPEQVETIASVLTRKEFGAGDVICGEGEDADRMWVLAKGSVSVRLMVKDRSIRIAGLAAGTTVGEMALLEHRPRSATVVADNEVIAYELTRTEFESVLRTAPEIGFKLLAYLAKEMARRTRISNQDLRAVDQ